MLQFTSPPMPYFIECGEKTYPVGGIHPNRTHIGVFALIVVTRGAHFIAEEDIAYHVPAGKFLILRPDRSHFTQEPCRQETHGFWLHFQTAGMWGSVEEREPLNAAALNFPAENGFTFYLPQNQVLRSPEKVHDLFRQLLFLRSQHFTASRWKEQQLFWELLQCLQEEDVPAKNNPYQHVAERTAMYLRQHYQETVSYKELSDHMHFHANYIALCMKKTYGCTPLEYLTRHRVDMAKGLLIYTNESMSKVAEVTGFRSYPYFVRCFRKSVGMSPTNFRQQYRSK